MDRGSSLRGRGIWRFIFKNPPKAKKALMVVSMTGLSRQAVSRIAAQHQNRAKHKYSMAMEMQEVVSEVEAMVNHR